MDGFMEILLWVALVGGVVSIILTQLPRIVVGCIELVEKYHAFRNRRRVAMDRTPSREGPVQSPDDSPSGG